MSGVNCIIYGCSSARTTPDVPITIPELLNTGEKYYCSYYSKPRDR